MAEGFILAVTAALVAMSAILNGWVLATIWAWFIVPFGIQQISIAHGIGICLVGRLIMGGANGMGTNDKKYKDNTEKLLVNIGVLFFMPLAAICMGWIVKNFM